jgi:hypothetical protein
MRRILFAVTVSLLGAGIAAGQETAPDGAVRTESELLTTEIYEASVIVNVSAFQERGGLRYAEYLIDTDGGDHQWCRTENFSLAVSPRSASLTFMPAVEESCPDPKLVTVVCRVSDDSNASRSVCNDRAMSSTVVQNSHYVSRELWGMDCAVAVGEFSASDVWGLASMSRTIIVPAH